MLRMKRDLPPWEGYPLWLQSLAQWFLGWQLPIQDSAEWPGTLRRPPCSTLVAANEARHIQRHAHASGHCAGLTFVHAVGSGCGLGPLGTDPSELQAKEAVSFLRRINATSSIILQRTESFLPMFSRELSKYSGKSLWNSSARMGIASSLESCRPEQLSASDDYCRLASVADLQCPFGSIVRTEENKGIVQLARLSEVVKKAPNFAIHH